jgi:hypothetical protein
VTSPATRGRYYGADLRSITPEGVERVMTVFARRYLRSGSTEGKPSGAKGLAAARTGSIMTPNRNDSLHAALSSVICDEELLSGV